MKLTKLYEENLEGIGFRNAQNLGSKIAQAMQLQSFNTKKNLCTPKAKQGRLKKGTGIGSSPVIQKPRHRKFFGLDKPQIPY